MAKYMSQVPPKPPKRSGSKVVEKPYKGSKAVSGGPSSTGLKPKPKSGKRNPAARSAAQEMPKKIGGTMGSTSEQAQQRKAQMLLDMRKRMMLRKKQG
jgi:hypothetical protein